jgi:OCT family organic cation transporter-like MFS transporter 4/5
MDFDVALAEAGELGPWQWGVLLLLVPAALLPGMWSVLFVFSGYVPRHRCRVDGCEADTPSYSEPWTNFSLPGGPEGPNPCSAFIRTENSSGCSPTSFSTTTTTSCSSFVFDSSLFQSTVVTEFSLVCDEGRGQLMTDLGQSMYSVGVLLGVLIPGLLSDRLGRKRMMYLAMALAAGSTLASAYATDYTTFLVLRVLCGVGTLGTFVTMCILSVELTGSRYKSLVGNLVHLLWAPGQMVLALTAYWLRDWRRLHIAVSVPVFLSLLLYPFTPESPRWLAAVGRTEEAAAILRTAARWNRRRPAEAAPALRSLPYAPAPAPSLRALVSSPGLITVSLILALNWLVVDFCYYGLSLHSVNLAGDIFLNFVLSAAVELPAVVLGMLGMDWAGRVSLLVFCQLLSGTSCILAGLLPQPLVLPLALVGKTASSIVFLTVYLYTAEIFPTPVRGLGLALTATAARIGGFAAPFIAGLGVREPSLPFLVFGGAALVGGLGAVVLPETRGHALPATLADMEAILQTRGCLGCSRPPAQAHCTSGQEPAQISSL